jgi:iron(III) transport system substrate-binding protein
MMGESKKVLRRKLYAHLFLLSIGISAAVIIYLINPLPDFLSIKKDGPEELVVYSSERTEVMDCVLSLFEEKYNISVKLVTGESEELIKELKANKEPTADVLMGVSPVELYGNEALYKKYISRNRDYTMVPYEGDSEFSTVYLLSGNCIVVNKTLARDINIEGYKDLLNPELKGKIAISDPYYSMMGFSHMISILECSGGKDSDRAWSFYKDILAHSEIKTSSLSVCSEVAKGKYIAGLAYDQVCAGLIKEGADIQIIYPSEGSLFMTKNAAILNDAPHPEYAEKFVDFLISKDMQDIFGTVLTARPVRIVAQTSGYLRRLDSLTEISADFQSYGKELTELKNKISRLMSEVTADE